MSHVLREMLWEYTLKCNKKCSYCGSKEVVNKLDESDAEAIRDIIATNIAEANLESLTFTGGEPSVLIHSLVNHIKYIKEQSPNTSLRVLTNGNLFSELVFPEFEKVYDLIDAVGISINEPNDIVELFGYINKVDLKRATMVTNFGNHNFKYYNQLQKVACMFGAWQVQLTMADSLYLGFNDVINLTGRLNQLSLSNITQVVIADNLNTSPCNAGLGCCSVTYDGYIIPCLSQRAWRKELEYVGCLIQRDSENRIFTGPENQLSYIWENGFKKQRFDICPCCKDFTGIYKIEKIAEAVSGSRNKDKKDDKKENTFLPMYGVEIPPIQDKKKKRNPHKQHTYVYGVFPPNNMNTPIVYGVFPPDNFTDDEITTTPVYGCYVSDGTKSSITASLYGVSIPNQAQKQPLKFIQVELSDEDDEDRNTDKE